MHSTLALGAALCLQEARLLAALVNKLGDPDRKLASKVRLPFVALLAACTVSSSSSSSSSSAWLIDSTPPHKQHLASQADAPQRCHRSNKQWHRVLNACVFLFTGDQSSCLQVGYLLTRLLAEHPGMSVPVVREVERFMFR